MRKHIYILFLLLFVIMGNCYWCAKTEASNLNIETNAFRVVREENAEKQICISYIFPMNSSKILKENLSQEDLGKFKFYLVSYVNALRKQYEEKEIEGVKVSDCIYFEKFDGVGFSIIFNNVEKQKEFFEVEEDSKGVDISTSGFFIKKSTIKMDFPISKNSAENMIKVCLYALENWNKDFDLENSVFEKLKKSFEEASFVYDYSTIDKSLKSKNQYQEGEFVHNVFEKKFDEIQHNPSIVFWVENPDISLVYIFVLCGVILIMFAFYYVKKNADKLKK